MTTGRDGRIIVVVETDPAGSGLPTAGDVARTDRECLGDFGSSRDMLADLWIFV